MAFLDLVDTTGFRASCLAGLVGALAIGIVAAARRPPVVLPFAATAAVVAAVVGLESTDALSAADPGALLTGLVGLAVAGLAMRLPGPTRSMALVTAIPGALLVAKGAGSVAVSWVPVFVVIASVVGAGALGDFDGTYRRTGLGPVLLAVTALGIYVCVPETQQAVALAGATIPVVLLGWPRPFASMGSSGAFAFAGLVTWVAVVGGESRPGSIIGATGCLGVMLVAPVARRAVGVRSLPQATRPWSRDAYQLLGLHCVLVAISSRIAGLRQSALSAAMILTATFLAAGVLIAAHLQRANLRG
jgi:hypothetical protein